MDANLISTLWLSLEPMHRLLWRWRCPLPVLPAHGVRDQLVLTWDMAALDCGSRQIAEETLTCWLSAELAVSGRLNGSKG